MFGPTIKTEKYSKDFIQLKTGNMIKVVKFKFNVFFIIKGIIIPKSKVLAINNMGNSWN